jgi:Xaa-Pro aminopeptidase/Xaa-Pro dipeptidase
MKDIFKKISAEGLDCFLFSSQPSVFYLSRFRSSHAYAILTAEGGRYLLTDSRYILKAQKELQPKGWETVLLKAPLFENIAKTLSDIGCKRVGVEGDRIKLQFFERLKCAVLKFSIRPVPIEGFLDTFRMVKDDEEIALIERAVEITDEVFSELVKFLKKNKTRLEELKERDIRSFILCEYLKRGAEGESFPSIVAAGENSAVPHHETGDTPLRNNEPLLIDTGCVYKGYCSDFTRVVFFGNPAKELLKIYEVVKEAHLRALEAVKPGRPVGEVDLAARKYIESKGYGEFFTHSTGHGVGIEIHEPPRVYKDEKTPMVEGMVFTIEPGIYIPDLGGVRLENIVVVTKEGAKVLQKTPLEPTFV